MIVPPVIIDDNGDVDFFASAEDAERYLEPWIVKEGDIAYDSEGRLLRFRVERGEAPIFFGLEKTRIDYVVIESAEDEPNHAPQLRATLIRFLDRAGSPFKELGALPLRELVRRGVEQVGFTS